MDRYNNILKILDVLLKEIPANQMSVITSVKAISESTGISYRLVFRTIKQLKTKKIIWRCERCWTDYQCFTDSQKSELRLVRFFLHKEKAEELFRVANNKTINHVPYHIENFNSDKVMIEVYKSHTTTSVYVKYYNKLTWENVTVRFADHPPSPFLKINFATDRADIINRLNLKVA